MDKTSAYNSIYAYPPDWMQADLRRKLNLAPDRLISAAADPVTPKPAAVPAPDMPAKPDTARYPGAEAGAPNPNRFELYEPTRYSGQRPVARRGKLGVLVDYSA